MNKNEKDMQNTSNVKPSKRYMFDFEQYAWNNDDNHNNLAKNAITVIENERQNIETDLKLLEAITREKSKQKDVMMSLFQLKEKLEKKLNLRTNE